MSHRARDDARNARAAGFGVLGSCVLHGLVLVVLVSVRPPPDLDFEFELPVEVEFGLTEAVEAVQTGVTQDIEPTEAESGPEGAETPPPVVDAGVDAGARDAGVDAGEDAGEEDAGEDAGDAGADADLVARGPPASLDGPASIPAGAQIAIRFDMARVRASPLQGDVRRLLASIPDWHLILNGSGIEPLDDLERLLLASPNLQRSQLVMAGRHTHVEEGPQYIRDVVERFGRARGQATAWQRRHGVDVVNWPNEDETERVLAIVGPRHFTISRPEDLQRVLSVAHARESENVEDDELESSVGADALLSMGAEDAFSVEVEGARAFIRRGDTSRIPTRLRAAVRQEASEVNVRAVGTYESPAEAERAAEYWRAYRDAQADALDNMFTRDLHRRVVGSTLEQEGARVRFSIAITTGQARLALSYLQGMLRASSRRRPRPNAVGEGSTMDEATEDSVAEETSNP